VAAHQAPELRRRERRVRVGVPRTVVLRRRDHGLDLAARAGPALLEDAELIPGGHDLDGLVGLAVGLQADEAAHEQHLRDAL
jgi:hypothetical protein